MALSDSQVSYYKCDTSGSFTDAHGSNDGVLNGATYTASGKINGAIDLDGSNDNIYVNHTYGIFTGSTDFTINLWFNPDTLTSGDVIQDLFRFYKEKQVVCYMYNRDSGSSNKEVEFYIGGINKRCNIAGADLSTGTWFMLTCTYSATGGMEIFLNGTSKDSNTNTGTISGASESYNNFGSRSTTQERFNGKLDEIGIWSRELTGAEITQLYNSGSGLQYPYTPPTPPSTLDNCVFFSMNF